MALIKKLVKLRLESLIREFDINMENFNIGSAKTEQNWLALEEKIIPSNYVTIEKNSGRKCILIIHNIIWKNIIKYELIENKWHTHMLHSNYRSFGYIRTKFLSMNYDYLLKINSDKDTYNYNNNKLQNLIINYLMLINPIILKYLIIDLSNIIKMYMFDVIITI